MNEEKIKECQSRRLSALTEAQRALGKHSDALEALIRKLQRERGIHGALWFVHTGRLGSWRFAVAMQDEENPDKAVFGSEVELVLENGEYYYDVAEPRRVTLNVGTNGSFGADDVGQVFKYRMAGALLDNFQALSELANAFRDEMNPLVRRFDEADFELSRLRIEKESAEVDAKMAEVEKSLRVGDWLKNKDYAYRVESITKGYVFLWEYMRCYWNGKYIQQRQKRIRLTKRQVLLNLAKKWWEKMESAPDVI